MKGSEAKLWSWLIVIGLVSLLIANCGPARGRYEPPVGADGAVGVEKGQVEKPVIPSEPTPRREPPPAPEPGPLDASEPPAPPDIPVAPDNPPVPETRPEPRVTPEPRPEPPPTGTCQGGSSVKPGEKKWQIKHDGVTRSYYVHIPPQYNGTTRIPVVLNFHGLNSNATQQKLLTSMNSLASKKGFIAIHAEGRGLPQSWNGGLCCSPASSVLKSKDVDFVRALLDDLEKKACIDTKRVYATGISNGAYISYRLACELSDRIAAVAPVAGIQLISPCKPKRPLSVIAFHGTADLIVPFEGRKIIGWPSVKDSVGFWSKHNGCNPTSKRVFDKGDTYCDEWSGCKNNTKVKLCVTKQGGHTWPGGFPIPGLGKTTNDIKATDELWNFMSQHRLP